MPGAGLGAGMARTAGSLSTAPMISRSAAISSLSALRPAFVALTHVRGLRPSNVFSIVM